MTEKQRAESGEEREKERDAMFPTVYSPNPYID